jgi:hypothetical protein
MDGIALPRAFRAAGRSTDVCDGSLLVDCRMYRGSAEVCAGLAKSAGAGRGSPAEILPMTAVLGAGQVLPLALLATDDPAVRGPAVAACALALLPRIIAVVRFRQSLFGAMLYPVGVVLLFATQWYALVRRFLGRPLAAFLDSEVTRDNGSER